MYNKITIVGRLTRDPELKYVGTQGIANARFTIACDRPFKTKSGEKETDFIPVVCWRGLAETSAEHLEKGRPALVSGRLELGTYEDDKGITRRTAEIVADQVVFLPDRQRNGDAPSRDVTEDDIPF